jgi:hypothetical protein
VATLITSAPLNFQQRIRSELTEALQLGYGDIQPCVLHMRVTVAGSGARPNVAIPAPATDQWRNTGDMNFIVGEVHAHLAMNELASESTVGATGLNSLVGVRQRTIVKALNTKVTLVNTDRNNLRFVETDITSNTAGGGSVLSPLSLASLLPAAGGSPVKLISEGYVMPYILPAQEQLQLTVSFLDGNATLGQTEYGLTLVGALVRSKVY